MVEGATDANVHPLLAVVVLVHHPPAVRLHQDLEGLHGVTLRVSEVAVVLQNVDTPRDLWSHTEQSVSAETLRLTHEDARHLRSVDGVRPLHPDQDAVGHVPLPGPVATAGNGMTARACPRHVADGLHQYLRIHKPNALML
jgi:hypothetical protein